MKRTTSTSRIGFVGGIVNAAFTTSVIILVFAGYFSAVGQIAQIA